MATKNRDLPLAVEPILRPVLKRLVQLLCEQYGFEFRYLSLQSDISPEVDLPDDDGSKGPFRVNDELWIPIFVQGQLTGWVQLLDQRILTAAAITDLNQAMNLALESAVLTTQSLAAIQKLETQLAAARVHSSSQRSLRRFDINDVSALRWSKAAATPCMLLGSDPARHLEVALEFHNRSGRYAFVTFSELEFTVRQDHSELSELGNVTLYVPEISQLSLEELKALNSMLAGASDSDPCWIVASLRTWAEIKVLLSEQPALLAALQGALIQTGNVAPAVHPSHIVDFFYQSLAQEAPFLKL